MKNIAQINSEFEQTLFLLGTSLVKAKNLLKYSGVNQESFDSDLKVLLEARQVDDSLKMELFRELDIISDFIKTLFQIDRKAAEKEIERLLLETLKLNKEDTPKVLEGILGVVGEK